MFSFGIEPSITSTYGASSSPRAAARKGLMNSSPPSVGDSTLLCRCTFGSPGTSPRTTSSSAGSRAAVTETESPSQLIPSEIQRMCTSSTPETGPLSAVVGCTGYLLLYDFKRLDQQFVSRAHVHVDAPACRTPEREPVRLALPATRTARDRRRHLIELERRS